MLIWSFIFLSVLIFVKCFDQCLTVLPLYGISSVVKNLEKSPVNEKCFSDIARISDGVDRREDWAVKMLDASGRFGSGYIWGNTFLLGSRQFCSELLNRDPLRVNYERWGESPKITNLPFEGTKFGVINMFHNNSFRVPLHLPTNNRLRLGLCIPDSCTEEDLNYFMEKYLESNLSKPWEIFNLKVSIENVRIVKEKGFWIFKNPIGVLWSLIVLGTLVTALICYFFIDKNFSLESEKPKNELVDKPTIKTQELSWKDLLKCFSFGDNFKEIFKNSNTKDSISCFHGLKFYTMIWIVTVHGTFYLSDSIDNSYEVFRLNEMLLLQPFKNATYTVDTFLFISGFLLAYIFYKTHPLENKKEKFNLPKIVLEFTMTTIHRVIRLAPSYIMMILSSIVLLNYFEETTTGFLNEEPVERCEKYCWRNLLFVNNLFPRSEMCLSWSWYLSVDMQLFLIFWPLLVLSTYAFYTAVTIVIFLLISTSIIASYVTYKVQYKLTTDDQYTQLDALYDTTWMRIGPYLIGVIFGYIFRCKIDLKSTTLSKRTVALLWLTVIILFSWIINGMYLYEYKVIETSIYMGLSRTLWGLKIGCLTLLCSTGNGGQLGNLLTSSFNVPFSRITYSTYLINPLIIFILMLTSDANVNITISTFVIYSAGLSLICFLLAFIYSALFEAPYIQLSKMIIKKNIGRVRMKEDRN